MQEHYNLRCKYAPKLTVTVVPCAATSHWRDQLEGTSSRSRQRACTVAVKAAAQW